MIQPILIACHCIQSISFRAYSDLSMDTLTRNLPQNSVLVNLCNLDLRYEGSCYKFEELISGSKQLPNLRSLKLPWPTISRQNDSNVDVPERLTLSESQHLAIAWPSLSEIEFWMKPMIYTRFLKLTWNTSPSTKVDLERRV